MRITVSQEPLHKRSLCFSILRQHRPNYGSIRNYRVRIIKNVIGGVIVGVNFHIYPHIR